MKEIIYYRTYSYGGMDDKDLTIRNFENPQLAKEDALMDKVNTNFKLYEIKLIFDGVVTEKKKQLEDLICYRDLLRYDESQHSKKI